MPRYTSQGIVYSIVIAVAAKEDLAVIAKDDPETEAEIAVLLQELKGNQVMLDALTVRDFGLARDAPFHVDPLSSSRAEIFGGSKFGISRTSAFDIALCMRLIPGSVAITSWRSYIEISTMTKNTPVLSSSLPLTTALAFPSTVDSLKAPSAPETRRADIVQWESCFRPQDVPIPAGFEDIDAYIEARERDTVQFDALKAARRRITEKLPESKITLAKIRLHRGWSQKRLADAIGTSQPHIARIENGRDNVLLSTANELSRALEVSLDDINKALGYASDKK